MRWGSTLLGLEAERVVETGMVFEERLLGAEVSEGT